jgi:hypothetical protein
MMPRAVTCVFLLAAAVGLRAADPSPANAPIPNSPSNDAREIVRRAAEHDRQNFNRARNYMYLQRQDTRELDHAGQVKSRKVESWEITYLEGSPYRRLVARNDQPLPPDEQKAEEERLRWNAEQRRHESTEERSHRVNEWQRRVDRQRDPIKEVPDAFDFKLLGQEQLAGRPAYRIVATPKPGFKPKSQFAAIFPRVKLNLWIDKADCQGARIEMEVLDSISFGGFVVRLTKGTRLLIEQTRVADGLWLPKQFSLTAAARILLVKGLNRELDFTFSDYKRIAPGSDVVALAEKP